jgi:hypothetical protein
LPINQNHPFNLGLPTKVYPVSDVPATGQRRGYLVNGNMRLNARSEARIQALVSSDPERNNLLSSAAVIYLTYKSDDAHILLQSVQLAF